MKFFYYESKSKIDVFLVRGVAGVGGGGLEWVILFYYESKFKIFLFVWWGVPE